MTEFGRTDGSNQRDINEEQETSLYVYSEKAHERQRLENEQTQYNENPPQFDAKRHKEQRKEILRDKANDFLNAVSSR